MKVFALAVAGEASSPLQFMRCLKRVVFLFRHAAKQMVSLVVSSAQAIYVLIDIESINNKEKVVQLTRLRAVTPYFGMQTQRKRTESISSESVVRQTLDSS